MRIFNKNFTQKHRNVTHKQKFVISLKYYIIQIQTEMFKEALQSISECIGEIVWNRQLEKCQVTFPSIFQVLGGIGVQGDLLMASPVLFPMQNAGGHDGTSRAVAGGGGLSPGAKIWQWKFASNAILLQLFAPVFWVGWESRSQGVQGIQGSPSVPISEKMTRYKRCIPCSITLAEKVLAIASEKVSRLPWSASNTKRQQKNGIMTKRIQDLEVYIRGQLHSNKNRHQENIDHCPLSRKIWQKKIFPKTI